MIESHGAIAQPAPEVQYVPREELRSSSSAGPSIWLILLAGIGLPCAIAYTLAVNEMAYSIAVFMGLLVGAAILARPFTGLAVILVLIYCRPEELFPSITGMRLTLIVSAFTLFATWIHLFVNREIMTKTPAITYMLGIAFLAPFSTIAVAGDINEAIREVWMLALLTIMILSLVRTRQSFQLFVTTLIAVTTYLAGYSLYMAQQGIGYVEKEDGGDTVIRSLYTGSIFSDPNDLASALIPGLALVLMRFINVKSWRKIPYAAIAVLLLFATFESQSRGGFLALVAMVIAFAVMNARRSVWALGLAVVIGAGVMVGAGARMSTIDTDDENAQSRMQFWQNGFDALQSSPLFGVGFEQYRYLNKDEYAAHNSYMQILVELGPAGLFCMMGLFYYAFRKPPAAARDDLPTEQDRIDLMGTRLSLIAFMVAAFFISRAFVPCLYIQCCLPIAQQISAYGRPDALKVNSGERARDWAWIAFWSIAMVVVIKIILMRYM